MTTKTTVNKTMWQYDHDIIPWKGKDTHTQRVSVIPYTDVQVGQENPGYRDRIKKGVEAGSDYTCSRFKYTALNPPIIKLRGIKPGTGYSRIESFGSRNNIQPPLGVSPSVSTALFQEAAQQVYSQYKIVKDAPDTIPFLVESRELSKLVTTPIESVFQLVEAVYGLAAWGIPRKGRALRQLLRAVGNLWLSWSFMWSPTIADIQSAARQVYNLMDDSNPTHIIRGRGTIDTKNVHPRVLDDAFDMSGVVNAYKNYDHSIETSVSLTYGIKLESSKPSGLTHFMDLYNTHPANFISAAWELLPFSWLVDYFYNVQSFLDATFVIKPNIVFGSQAVKHHHKIKTYWSAFLVNTYKDIYALETQPGEVTLEYVNYTRTVLDSFPGLPFEITTQKQRESHGIPKLLNLISVLQNVHR